MNPDTLVHVYTAGYFDGEGCVIIMRQTQGCSFNFRLKIGSCDYYCLAAVQSYWGGSLNSLTKRLSHHKPSWVWNINGLPSIEVAKAILPYTMAKDDQLHLYIHAYEDYISFSSDGNRLDREHRLRVHHLMSKYKIALEAMRHTSAFC